MNSESNGRVNFSQEEGQREANIAVLNGPYFSKFSHGDTLSNGRTLKRLLHLHRFK